MLGRLNKNGMISLRPIYDFITTHADKDDAIQTRTSLGKEYSALCNKLVDSIDRAQGFYLWGFYENKKKYWRSTYLGKAGFGDKKSLWRRLLDELNEERCCFWRTVRTDDELQKIRSKIYLGKYEREWKRAMLKTGATHIAWVAAPNVLEKNIRFVEADLIEALNPNANRQRPTPPNNVQNDATTIFQDFRRLIHQGRDSAYRLKIIPTQSFPAACSSRHTQRD